MKSREIIQDLINEFGDSFKEEHLEYVSKSLKKSKKLNITSFGYTKGIELEVMESLKEKYYSFNEIFEEVIEWIKENSNNPNIEETLKDQHKEFQLVNQYFENKITIRKRELREEFRSFFNFQHETFISNLFMNEKNEKINNFGYFHYKGIVIKFQKTKEELLEMVCVLFKLSEKNMKDKEKVKEYASKYFSHLYMIEIEKLQADGKKINKKFIQKGKNIFEQYVEKIFKKLGI
jgi:hypothetical protein